MDSRFSYPAAYVGATGEGRTPPGYRRLAVSVPVGSGEGDFAAAAGHLAHWRMHRAMGVAMDSPAPRAAPGVPVTVGLGVGRLRLRAPCRVVWTLDEPGRAGWAYGTLPGHPERGEEAFTVRLEADGTVRLEVTAFSLPASWYTRAAGPLVPVLQRAYARRCGAVLRRLLRQGGTS